MNLLIKSAKIIDPQSEHHLKVMDLLINDGKLIEIAPSLSANDQTEVFNAPNLHVSGGWIDLHANFQDPGFEHKEDLKSGIQAAAAGGFTSVCLSAETNPVRDSKAGIEYTLNRAKGAVVDLLPYGAISKNAEGKELAELHDLKVAGACAFFDGKRSIKNPRLLHHALLYCQAFDGLVMNFPFNAALAENGVMNEGTVSTKIGLKGIPELTEELMLARDLYLVEHCGGKMHFATISGSKSIELLKAAKAKGLKVSCDVSAAHLWLTDASLEGFDSRFKVLPPFRSEESRKKLIEAIKDGTINAICSDHLPEDIESKKREIDHAAFGIINLQTAFAAARMATKDDLSIEALVKLFTSGPAEVLGLDPNRIELEKQANLTLFNPDESFTFEKSKVISKSLNSPFFGQELMGKVYGVINNDQKLLSP